jgi:hypothetical protein
MKNEIEDLTTSKLVAWIS